MIERFALAALIVASPLAAQAPAAQAPQGPQPILRATVQSNIDAAFNSIDANKDGFTDRAEIIAAETKALNARKAAVLRDRETAFKALDADGNGQLTLAEFNAKVVAAPIKSDPTPALNQLDTNKDGKISLAENRALTMARFDKADTNKDGTLSVAEQRASMPTRR